MANMLAGINKFRPGAEMAVSDAVAGFVGSTRVRDALNGTVFLSEIFAGIIIGTGVFYAADETTLIAHFLTGIFTDTGVFHAADEARILCETPTGLFFDARPCYVANVAAVSSEMAACLFAGARSPRYEWLVGWGCFIFAPLIRTQKASLFAVAVGIGAIHLNARGKIETGVNAVAATIATGLVASGASAAGAASAVTVTRASATTGIIAMHAVDILVRAGRLQTAPRGGDLLVRGRRHVGQHTDVDGGLFGGLEGGIVGGDGGRTRTGHVGRDRPLEEGAGCAGGIGKRIGGAATDTVCNIMEQSDRIGSDRIGSEVGTDRAREGTRDERKVDHENMCTSHAT